MFIGAAALTIAPAVANTAAAEDHHKGSAYALSVRATLLDAPLVTVDPVPAVAYPPGGEDSLATVGPNAAGLVSAHVLNASSNLASGTLASKASLADVIVKDILRAELLTAECTAGTRLAGTSSVGKLTVLGQNIDISTAPNTKINVLDVATVIINEQIHHANRLTVNAVHVTIGGPIRGIASADIVLSQAECMLSGSTTTPPSTTTTTTQPPTTTTLPSTIPSEPTDPSTITTTTTPTDGAGGGSGDTGDTGDIEPASNSSDLAETGVSGILPLLLGAVVLLAAGAGTLFYTRRRRNHATHTD